MTRYLVTGATGGLGKNAVYGLLDRGVRVRATGRNRHVGALLRVAGADFVPLDLAHAQPHALTALLDGIDVIWHCAALTAPFGARDDFLATNTAATVNLLQAAAAAGASRFVHVSTPSVYFDFRHRYLVAEDGVATTSVNAYAESKLRAEAAVVRAAATTGMQCIILRPRALFGPHDTVLLPRLLRLRRACAGVLPLPRGGRTVLDVTYMDNVVHAMHLASEAPLKPRIRIFNITNDEPDELRNVVDGLFAAIGRRCRIVGVPYAVLDRAARFGEWFGDLRGREPALTRYGVGSLAFDLTLDIGRVKRELGYRPVVPLDEAIRRTAEWMNQRDG